jgi:hypothetical protein
MAILYALKKDARFILSSAVRKNAIAEKTIKTVSKCKYMILFKNYQKNLLKFNQ